MSFFAASGSSPPKCLPGQTPKPIHDRVSKADHASEKYLSELDHQRDAIQPSLYRALTAIYAVCHAFADDDEGREAFLESRSIKAKPNTENPYQPLVKAFLVQKDRAESRERITTYAGAIAEAIRQRIKPAGFRGWIETTTIRAAYADYRKSKRLPENSLRVANEQNQRVTAILGSGSIDLPSHPDLAQPPGRYIGVIQIDANGAHLIRLLTNLNQGQVRSIILRGGDND
jgi:hypothetical protein